MTTPTILIVDDDPAMARGLRDNFEIEGYRAITASSIAEARRQLALGAPDLILLDVMLPDGDGIDFCKSLRREGLNSTIVLLTARGQEMDKVLGLEMGADDYVTKPFGLRELLARVNAHLRRQAQRRTSDEEIKVGEATVDFKRHQLSRDGAPVEISAKELELLRYLVEHRGEVVSRDQLLSDVWGHQRDIATRTVDNFVVRLRKKIEPNPTEPRFLLTVHGSGYKLVEQ